MFSVGIGTLWNLFLGVSAVRGVGTKDQAAQPLNRMRHKGLMFFSIFWILGSAFDECLMSAAQAVFHECFIDFFVIFLCAATGQTLQISSLILGAHWYEKSILEHRFAKVNLAFLGIRALFIWSSVVYMLWTGEMYTKGDENSCFAPSADVETDPDYPW